MMKAKRVLIAINVLLIAMLACNLASGPANTQPDLAATQAALGIQMTVQAQAPAQGQPNVVPASAGTPTVQPLVATIMASTHVATPGEPPGTGKLNYDVDSSVTGTQNRAPYGDFYPQNLFERPFTLDGMKYVPQLDIQTFQLDQTPAWDYITIDLSGGDVNDPTMNTNYGVELDTNHDGFGDYLIWASPPYSTQWLAETVQVYQDTNHDTGGLSAEKSDAVLPGNGYDKLIFDRGQGDDKDLAWVRLNPGAEANIQIAFKPSLAGSAFMWGVVADSGLRDPSKFNYNDRFTEEQAGSPEKSEKLYPIKAIYQVDNTCWEAIGFKVTGYEPRLCPAQEPRPIKKKAPPPPPSLLLCAVGQCIPWLPVEPTLIPPPK
jgi:hypothetical protein